MSLRNNFSRGLLAAAVTFILAVTAAAQSPPATPPPPGPPRPLKVPTPVERTLANGLRVIVIQRSYTPLVTAQMMIKNGAEVDPPTLAGLAHLTASLLTQGTKTKTATQIAQAVDALGGTQSSEAQWDSSTAWVEVMSDKIDPAMGILSEVVLHPAFAAEEIERLRQQYIDYLNVQLGEPGSIASFVGTRVLFGNSAYAHGLGGSPQSLKRIRRADVVKFHQTYYRPDNAIMVIGGDISPDDGFALVEKYFGSWQRPATLLPRKIVRPQAGSNKGRVVVVDMPDAGQAAVLLIRAGISRRDPEFFRGLVTNSVLDGYSGRLNQEIRIKRGLSYGASSYLDVRRDPGPFTASAQTRNDAAPQVAKLLIQEVGRLATTPVTETELVPRKAVLLGGFARELEEINGLVGDLSYYALMGLELSEMSNYVNKVQAVSVNEIREFAGKHREASEASIIIVGKAKDFLPALRKEFGHVEVIPIKQLDLDRASLRRVAAKKAH
jgi:zinc protease